MTKLSSSSSSLHHISDSSLHELFHQWDMDGNGTLDFSEIVTSLAILCGDSKEEKLMFEECEWIMSEL